MDECEKRGVPYCKFGTLPEIFAALLVFLYTMGHPAADKAAAVSAASRKCQ